MAKDLFTNQGSTTVSSGGTTAPAQGATESWTVASSSTFPAASNAASPPTQFYVSDPALPSETVLVTNVSGTTWSVTRGADGTTPVAHTAGFMVRNVVTAVWLQALANLLSSTTVCRQYAAAFGDGSTLNYVITHSLGTQDVQVTVRNASAPYEQILVDNEATSASTVTLRFATAPTTNQFRVVVQGAS